MRWVVSISVLGVLVAGTAWWWYTGSQPPTVREDHITSPRLGNIVRGPVAVGRVEPRTRVELKSKANGIIRELRVDVGDPVSRGDVLVELDKEILEAGVAEAEARLEQARGALDAARAQLTKIEVEKSDPELVYAARNWERAQRLYAEGIASEDERDIASDRHEKAQYSVRLLESEQQIAGAGRVAAEGRLKEMQARADLARQELREATITSPIDGVVLYRYLEEGDSVSSIRVAGGNATVIMTLGDLSELYVDGEVDEVHVGDIIDRQRIRNDLTARITVESFKNMVFLGRVTRIAPLGLEDQNGIVTFEVRITLMNPERLLLANMTANSQIILEEKEDVLLLSQGALLRDGDARFALVYDPQTGRTRRREVKVGISDGKVVEVLSGLAKDEKVVMP